MGKFIKLTDSDEGTIGISLEKILKLKEAHWEPSGKPVTKVYLTTSVNVKGKYDVLYVDETIDQINKLAGK